MELHPVDISDYRTLTSSLRGILISRNRKGIRKVLPRKSFVTWPTLLSMRSRGSLEVRAREHGGRGKWWRVRGVSTKAGMWYVNQLVLV